MKIFYLIIFFICFLTIIPNSFGEIVFLDTFGELGEDIEQFKKPSGIAIQDDQIFVSELKNDRIQILDLDGNFKSFIHLEGGAHGVEVKDDRIYVAIWADRSNVSVFNLTGEKLFSIFNFDKLGDIAIDNNGRIFVTDYGEGKIKIFDSNGKLLEEFFIKINDKKNSVGPTGITLDSLNNIYITDYEGHQVLKLNSSGEFILEFLVPLEVGGKFFHPTNLEINSNQVFVTDVSDRVLVFDKDGKFSYSFGQRGQEIGQFDEPHGISFDKFGNVYVVDYSNHRIQVFAVDENSGTIDKNSSQINWFSELINWLRSFFYSS